MAIRIDPVDGFLFVDAASTASLTLSGLQTVDGVSLTAGKLCLAKDQASVRAVYMVQSGAWLPVDPGIGFGLQVCVRGGTANAGAVYRCTTADPITWGTTATTFITVAGSGGAVSGPSGTFGNVILTGAAPTLTAGQSGIGRALTAGGTIAAGLAAVNQAGGSAGLITSATTATAAAVWDLVPISLANNATFDYTPENGGVMLVVVPGATSAPQAVIGFAANGAVTLNGVTPAGGISLTQDNASTLNIYASGGKSRFQNKVGSTINVIIAACKFFAA